jgi:hypothetical protein
MVGNVVHVLRMRLDKTVKCGVFTGTDTTGRVSEMLEQYVFFDRVLSSGEQATESQYKREE